MTFWIQPEEVKSTHNQSWGQQKHIESYLKLAIVYILSVSQMKEESRLLRTVPPLKLFRDRLAALAEGYVSDSHLSSQTPLILSTSDSTPSYKVSEDAKSAVLHYIHVNTVSALSACHFNNPVPNESVIKCQGSR